MLSDYILFWWKHNERPALTYKEVMRADGSIVPFFQVSADASAFHRAAKQMALALQAFGRDLGRAKIQ